jgi:NhaA family Na+:H+ antiporter
MTPDRRNDAGTMTRHFRVPLGRLLPPTGEEFVSVETLGGVGLLVASLAALVWANLSPSSYNDVWSSVLTIGVGDAAVSESLQHWVNDGLMTVFFFVAGLEIKRELVEGELHDRHAATLPVVAALGGMALPAGIYALVNWSGAGAQGWGIPMATDIAFAISLLALLGSRVPRQLKIFLLTLAIVDDVGAIIVIALFYSGEVTIAWLLGAGATVALIGVMRRIHIASPLAYVAPALVLWICLLESGVHATIAGVVLGLLTPARSVGGRRIIDTLEHHLHPWSSFLVMPLFALANAGIPITRETLTGAADSPITWGIIGGLVVGKPLGILGASALTARIRGGSLPNGLRLTDILGAGALAGIGFTVSLFVADLAFTGAQLEHAKLGILSASVASGLIGSIILAVTHRRRLAQRSSAGKRGNTEVDQS